MSSYATPADLTTYGVNANAIKSITTQQQQAALDTAASRLDSYLRARITLPLVSWGTDVRRHCAIVAAYDLITSRGLDPDGTMAEQLKDRFEAENTWLTRIARGEVLPEVVGAGALDPTEDIAGSGAFALQTTISGNSPPNGLSLGGAPPTSSEQDAGTVIVGSPKLRGW